MAILGLASQRVVATMTQVELGWVVGIIEGEGCIRIHTPSKGRLADLYPSVKVAMTDEDVVRRLHEVTGVGVFRHVRNKARDHYKDQFVWQVSAVSEVESLLTTILSQLGVRRAEAATGVLEICKRRREAADRRVGFCNHGHSRDEHGFRDPSSNFLMCRLCREANKARSIAARAERNRQAKLLNC